MASNFRALFQLQFNQWSKHPKGAAELWPLSIDDQLEQLSDEEMYARNERIINEYRERYGVN
jgi:hypothetical protein